MTTIEDLPEAARAFVEGDVALLPSALAPAEVEALVALLVARGDAARLSRLAEAADKSLGKPARRGLHLLKTRGALLPDSERRAWRPPGGPYAKEAELPSLASLIDGRGERVVWLVRPGNEGGVDVYQAELSEIRGLISFEAGSSPRKQWRLHARRVLADPRMGVTEVPAAHVRWLVDEAKARTLAAGRALPEAFVGAQLDLGPLEVPAEHPALALAPPLADATPTLRQLHELPEVQSWIPEREALDALDVAVGEIVTSKLVVHQAERLAQLAEALDKVLERTVTAELRARLSRRLLETAYLLALRGQLEEARRCTAAAALTSDAAVSPGGNPFLLALYDKVLDASRLSAEPAPEGEPPSEPKPGSGSLLLP